MKKTMMRTLAMALALFMVLGMLPAGLLSFTVAAETPEQETKTIYVATTGSDDNDGTSWDKAFATIQKAVNSVPSSNTVPTTILIGDGAYNVHVPAGDPNHIKGTGTSYGHNLMIAKKNLTLKAQNNQKVVIYSYAATLSKLHFEDSTLNIYKSTNLTFDGLVILPPFADSLTVTTNTSYKKSKSAESFNELVKSFFTEPGDVEVGDVIDTETVTTVYQYSYGTRGVIRNDGSVAGSTSSTNYGLTFKNCYIDAVSAAYALGLESAVVGDYHLIGNTFAGNVAINGAGNEAEVANEIRGNTFLNKKTIVIADTASVTVTKLPVIEYNTFKAVEGGVFTAGNALIENKSATLYTPGELSVICQKTEVVQAEGGPKNIGVSTAVSHQKIQAQTGAEDKTIDTEEELAYWMTQTGSYSLAADIVMTKDILPAVVTATMNFGDYTVTKDANAKISAPEGYVWQNGTTLIAHVHVPAAEWTTDGEYHWNACEGGDGCTEQLNKKAHVFSTDDGNCITPEECGICHLQLPAEPAHVYDTDCTTDDECANPGCSVKTTKENAHIFDTDCATDDECQREGCDQKAGANATHKFDADCTTDDVCQNAGCTAKATKASAHLFDNNCITADVCAATGCEQKAAAAAFHIFDDNDDTTCNTDGCGYTREPVEGKFIYVATTGNDETGDGSAENPYATIQRALNNDAVPAGNTVPTTILIADGAYNVFIGNQTLKIGKSNLTLKAVNNQKVVIYGYSDGTSYTYNHHNNSVLRIDRSLNLTFDGLVILPNFTDVKPTGLSWANVNASIYNELVRDLLGITEDLFVGDANGKIYFNNNQSMIRTDGGNYASVPSNGDVTGISGLTFQYCYLDGWACANVVNFNSTVNTGDYHFIGNTITGNLTVNGAGNAATINSEIRDNIFVSQAAAPKQIVLKGAIEKLPIIEGNIFKNAKGVIGDGQNVIDSTSTAATYTEGELAVMALTNSVANSNEYCNLKYDVAAQKITVTSQSPDTTIDTQEELAYWLTLGGDVVLGGDITVTKDILPRSFTANLIFGEYKVTKAEDADIPAPEGYSWLFGTTLAKHTHDPAATWSFDGEYHWYDCNTDGCYEKLDKTRHDLTDDFNCTTAEVCSVCNETPRDAQPGHVFDADCTTNDQCQNPGCKQMAGRNEFHIYTDRRDATCDAPGCEFERELLKEDIIYVSPNGNDETGDGSMERPFATIQRAVNDVPANNTVPTTILIADGLYNVFVDQYDPMRWGKNGSTLLIAKSNLTLKAVNPQKVVIYGYSDASVTTYDHYNNYVIRIDNSENLTFDGLVILPHFSTVKHSDSWKSANASTYNKLLRDLLGITEDVFVGDAEGKMYSNNSQSTTIYTGTMSGYALPTNGTVTTVSGLTFKNCYLDGAGNANAIVLDGANVTGDYHFIGNTIAGNVTIKGAGNNATVDSEIRDNFIITTSATAKQIKFSGTIEKLPVLEGNTFKNVNGNIGSTSTVIALGSTGAEYTDGELSVICQTNYLGNTNSVIYLYVSGVNIKATDDATKVDDDIDTQEELFYWLTQGGTCTLAGDIELTEALPANINATLVLGSYSVTKPAGLASNAPAGFCWAEGNTTLAAHSWSATYLPEERVGVTAYHAIYCTNCQLEQEGTREACTPDTAAEGEFDCTVATRCAKCNGINVAARLNHSLTAAVSVNDNAHVQSCKNCDQVIRNAHESAGDGNCLTADACACGYVVREAKLAHNHVLIKRDANAHWYQCEWCESTTEVEAHVGGTATCAKRAVCDVCYKEYGQLNADNHSFTNYVSDNNTTCEVRGTKTAVCDWCATAKDTVTDEDAIPSHNFEGQEWKASADGHYMECVNFANCGTISEKVAHTGGAATCSALAQCEVCGASYGEFAADVHSFTNYVSDGNATCVADGTKTAKCDDCSATDTVTDIGSILGHSYTNYVANNDATCLADGTETAICDNGCNGTATRRVLNSALGHSFTNFERTGDATCLADGTKTAVCDNGCGAISTVADPGSALGHSFTNFVSDGNATCTADGTKTAVCNNGCGSSQTVADPGSITGHNFDGKDWVSNKDGHWVRCVCGEKSMAAHTAVVTGAKEATETETGYTGDTSCEVCGYQIAKGEIIAKLPVVQGEGLSTGAIVAIVVGSVAVIGLLGFGGYWFLIKKKP